MISVVVPLFNEEESLVILYKELTDVVAQLDKSYEIIFIDDGSLDSSLKILKNLAAKDKRVRVFSFQKNRGKSEALCFGFSKAKGKYVITMDADLQDWPSEAYKLMDKMKEGFDHVSGWRKEREDSGIKIIFSKIFNFAVSVIFDLKLHDYNCGLKAYTLNAAQSLSLYGGLHRFIPILLHQEGFRVSEVFVIHQKRRYGKSKFGISKVWRDLPDMFTMIFLIKYSNRPLHFFGIAGFLLFVIGFGTLLYLSFIKIFLGQAIGERPLLFLGILLILSGLQVLFTGFLADLIINLSQKKSIEPLLKYSSD